MDKDKIVDTIVNQRFLAYVSEVGESLRPVIPKKLVNAGYLISLAYVGAETAVFHRKNNNDWIRTMDRGIWHGFASMLLPAVAVNRIVHLTSYATNKYLHSSFTNTSNSFIKPRIPKYLPTLVACAAIPFIIHPIDHGVDWVMDRTLRKFYFKK